MNKTDKTFIFTFDNNIRSLEQYKVDNSKITIIGEQHVQHSESNISEFINDILLNNDNTCVFLELDTKLVNDEIYMKGIQSSTIKDIVQNFNKNRLNTRCLYYFDNRNDYLGVEGHYNLYFQLPKDINIDYYIQKYTEHYDNMSQYIKSKHRKIKKIIEDYEKIVIELPQYKNKPKRGRLQIKNKMKQIVILRDTIISEFREFWANVIDEKLVIMMLDIIKNNPDTKYDLVVLVGTRHAHHLKHMFETIEEYRIEHITPPSWRTNNPRQVEQEPININWWDIISLSDLPEINKYNFDI